MAETAWYAVDPGHLEVDRIATVVVAGRAVCITRTADGYGALDNRCPHQGGPLGDGQIENGYVICPWHGYEYNPCSGRPPEGFPDAATSYAVEERDGGLFVELPVPEERVSLMDQVVDVLTAWGIDTVFGMVGHSNLGLAEALRKAEEAGRIRFIGIRHEGAAAFAASGYAKLTGHPAACFSIAGPGATNLLTGLWDAKVDRAPILALTGQVQTQVLGPGAFQEVPLAAAFDAVSEWSQTVLSPTNATELAALAVKHAVVNRDVAHLIFPDEVQELPGVDDPPERPRDGRIAASDVLPPADGLARAAEMLREAKRPVIVVGNGARPHRDRVIELAERIDAPIITTFKAKGLVPDSHPLACGVLGRSGTPVGSAVMARSDCLLVLGASFSNHTGIAPYKPIVQVDFDPMALGRFHPVTVPVLGHAGITAAVLRERVGSNPDRVDQRADIAERWAIWRAEKARRLADDRMMGVGSAAVFDTMTRLVPDGAVVTVDVGNHAYSFGRYYECGEGHSVLMSGYLGSIGFGFPAAMGAWAADPNRTIVTVTGDGGFGQYLAELTTAVKYDMNITHVLLNNSSLGKISSLSARSEPCFSNTSFTPATGVV